MAVAPSTIIEAFERSKVIPVFYHDDAEVCCEVLAACYQAGIRVFEFTNRGENARRNFAVMRDKKLVDMPDMYLGIGTVKNAEEAKAFAGAGADFIISPITDVSIADACKEVEILWVPGCMTPSEIAVAEKTGAGFVKLFPGSLLGPDFVTAIKPLFPKMKFMPTGGVAPTKESIQSWLDAGVVCVGMGSNLLSKEHIAKKDWAGLKTQLEKVVEIVKNIR
jgi:2-dehydro-3-deoxyphosphogluconate aldolase/(4S)-4-hydroxy-2-oxoglutarate aldolase